MEHKKPILVQVDRDTWGDKMRRRAGGQGHIQGVLRLRKGTAVQPCAHQSSGQPASAPPKAKRAACSSPIQWILHRPVHMEIDSVGSRCAMLRSTARRRTRPSPNRGRRRVTECWDLQGRHHDDHDPKAWWAAARTTAPVTILSFGAALAAMA